MLVTSPGSPAPAEPFRNLVVGIDLSAADRLADTGPLGAASAVALDRAVSLAAGGGHIHLLTAIDVDPFAETIIARSGGGGRPSILDQARRSLESAAKAARDAGAQATCEVVLGHATETLLADAQKNRRDLVVVGTRERSTLARNLLGSTALALLRRCPAPVWIARRAERAEKVVLAAIALGDLAIPVLRAAQAVARRSGAALHVLHVVDLPAAAVLRAGAADREAVEWYRRERRVRAEAEVPRLLTEALGPGAPLTLHLLDGETADTVLERAKSLAADAVVMGSVKQSGVRALVLGSTAEKVLPSLDTSLLLVKPTLTALPAHR